MSNMGDQNEHDRDGGDQGRRNNNNNNNRNGGDRRRDGGAAAPPRMSPEANIREARRERAAEYHARRRQDDDRAQRRMPQPPPGVHDGGYGGHPPPQPMYGGRMPMPRFDAPPPHFNAPPSSLGYFPPMHPPMPPPYPYYGGSHTYGPAGDDAPGHRLPPPGRYRADGGPRDEYWEQYWIHDLDAALDEPRDARIPRREGAPGADRRRVPHASPSAADAAAPEGGGGGNGARPSVSRAAKYMDDLNEALLLSLREQCRERRVAQRAEMLKERADAQDEERKEAAAQDAQNNAAAPDDGPAGDDAPGHRLPPPGRYRDDGGPTDDHWDQYWIHDLDAALDEPRDARIPRREGAPGADRRLAPRASPSAADAAAPEGGGGGNGARPSVSRAIEYMDDLNEALLLSLREQCGVRRDAQRAEMLKERADAQDEERKEDTAQDAQNNAAAPEEKKEAAESEKDEDDDEGLCVICLDNARDCLLKDCGHWHLCMACAAQCKECPVCRKPITGRVHAA